MILIFNRDTGEPQALVDGTSVTYWRTAAVSALASQYLSRQDSKHLLQLDTSQLATFMALAHASEKISVWGRSSAKIGKTNRAFQAGAPQIEATTCDALPWAVLEPTSSAVPLFDSARVSLDTYVQLVGAQLAFEKRP